MSVAVVAAAAAVPAQNETHNNCAWYSKMAEYLRRHRHRNRINPTHVEIPESEFFTVGPNRTIRVFKPELKSERYYEPPKQTDRPESINDNFYSRWARRPHPSGNCRCSFRQSRNSSRLSTHEEQVISQEIQRIRTSLCEAEKRGTDIQELEKSLAVDLSQLEAPTEEKTTCEPQESCQCGEDPHIEPLEEDTKKKIVKDLDRYISDLLDEILDDTIRAIARADNPFEKKPEPQPTTTSPTDKPSSFDISFTFHKHAESKKLSSTSSSQSPNNPQTENCYVNRGFIGSTSNPDTLDFHLRPGDPVLENADCTDSGINSVETVELQPEHNEQHNLEQSLIDIIDAKLGGSSIGKSLEDLGMEIDATEDANEPKEKEAEPSEAPIPATKDTSEAQKSTAAAATPGTPVSSPPVAPQRTSKSLDEVIEEPPFNSLRLEFKRSSTTSSGNNPEPKPSPCNVTSKVNKTVSVIRQRLATRLSSKPSPRKQQPKKPKNKNKKKKKGNDSSANFSRASTRASLELEDYRRRFPVPDTTRFRNNNNNNNNNDFDEVTLRKSKPMLIFLHGFGASAETFEPQLRYFADLGYPCLAPDLLGHGFSSASNRAKDYHFDKLLADIESVLLHFAFKPGQKCIIVGHNYGCTFATALAHKYVGNIHQLVLISGGGPTPLAPPPAEGAGHCCLRASLAPLLFCGLNRGVLYAARGRQHPYCGGEEHEDQWPSHMRHVLRGMSWPEGDYVFHRRICTPTLLVHGLRDNKVSLVQECQMERTMVKAFLEAIPAAGHIPMTDCPEQLNHMIHCFIDLWKNKKW